MKMLVIALVLMLGNVFPASAQVERVSRIGTSGNGNALIRQIISMKTRVLGDGT